MAVEPPPRPVPSGDPRAWSQWAGGSLHHVMVEVDGSEASLHAVALAGRIASGAGAQLTVLHVRPEPPVFGGLTPAWCGMLEQWREDLEYEVGIRVTETLDPLGIRWRLRIESGDPVQRINQLATAIDADLIVVGSGGCGLLRTLLGGSIATRLLRHERRPVLVVR
jgi:nucleotide-binding universal stress UspA family protein